MKKTIVVLLVALTFILSCQKYVEPPAHDKTGSPLLANVVAPRAVVTFGKVSPLRTITTTQHNIIFSDSLMVTDDEAIIKSFKFDISGQDLFFSNYAIFINGVRSAAAGTYENGLLTVTPAKPIALYMGNYKLDIRARVICPPQLFSVQLNANNVTIVNYYYEFAADLYGLPLSYSIVAKKN